MDELEYKEPSEPWFTRWAIALSLASIPVLLWMFRAVLHTVHVHFIDQLPYPRFTDDGEEVFTDISYAGWYVIIITLMIARRLFLILQAGGFKYHMDRESILMWNTVHRAHYLHRVRLCPGCCDSEGPAGPLARLACAHSSGCYRVYKAILRAPSARS